MIQKPNRADEAPLEQFPIPAALVEHILLGPADDRRVLQDSPVLADVWLAYAADPASIQDLLITPRGRLLTPHAFRHLGLAEPAQPAAQFGLFGEGEE